MPTLFISYKRGTAAVAPLMEKLRAAHYRLWFDRDEIHLGDPDWRARIDQGLQQCDGVLLNITPAACKSEPIRYEVSKARALGKPIFAIILERIDDYAAAIRDLGLPERQHLEDFTDVTRWDEQIQRLLDDLKAQGLRVTRHERRQQRDIDNPHYVLHQQYLRRLAERVGMLDLAQIQANAQGVPLEAVYVDSPTGLSISIEIKDWQVIDWWLDREEDEDRQPPAGDAPRPRTRPQALGYAPEPLNALISQIDARIADYREAHPELKPDDRSWRNAWNNGEHANVLQLHLEHLAAARDRLVILGAPGSGKSTFVRFLALALAGAQIDGWSRPLRLSALENWTHGALTPVYIELRRFVASPHFPQKLNEACTTDHLWAYIKGDLLGADLQEYADELQYDLEHGHALLILDGLDEVPYPEGGLQARQTQLIGLAQSLNTRYAGSRILVASRPHAYDGWKLPGFEAVTITAFADEHRLALAQKLYLAAGESQEQAEEMAAALNKQLVAIDEELKDRPLFVTLMARIFFKRRGAGLPTRRGALYRESILLLLDRWTTHKPNARTLLEILGDHSVDDLLARLAALAYDVHAHFGHQPGTPEIDEGLLYQHLKPLGRGIAAELIPYLSENAGVLVSPGQNQTRDVFRFAHRTFQEYLAAVQLITDCQRADSFEPIRHLICEKPDLWRLPCALAGDVLADTDRRSDLWTLIDDLIDDALPEAIASDDPRWHALSLAAVITHEQALAEQANLRKGERAIRDTLIAWLVKLIQTPQALPPVERAACGRALALLGDPRPGVGLRFSPSPSGTPRLGEGRGEGIPDILWSFLIPAGSYTIGGDDAAYQSFPSTDIRIAQPYRVGKYLVTQAQYFAFQNDSSERGYTCPDWWTGLAASDDDKRPAAPNFRYDNHPMENVNWYQTVAFTRWLTFRLRGMVVAADGTMGAAGRGLMHQTPKVGGMSSDGVWIIGDNAVIRLPHEYEWEVAARGTDGRSFPYAGDFDPLKGNVYETGIRQTSAVGIFPDGESPCGALDMSGNTLEWCENHFNEPDTQNLSGTDVRSLRGGSWSYDEVPARAAARLRGNPRVRLSRLGFRLAVARLIPL
jgi:formylglycine-generating enzyme required for sulfatase activity/energy-coupling factor transporter ATP-binding protein EcfA2